MHASLLRAEDVFCPPQERAPCIDEGVDGVERGVAPDAGLDNVVDSNDHLSLERAN